MTTIPLAPSLLAGSCDLPGSLGRTTLKRLPIWSCSVRGLACHSPYSERGALLPHLFTLTGLRPSDEGGRYIFCATFLQVTLTGDYPAHCPTEFGLSSPHAHRGEHARRSSGCLRRNVKEHQLLRRRSRGPHRPAPFRSGGATPCVAFSAWLTRQTLARYCTARASCTDCSGVYRFPRRSSRCSTPVPGACRPESCVRWLP